MSSKITEQLMTDKGSVEFSIPSKYLESNLKSVTLTDEEGTSKDNMASMSSPNPRKRSPRN